MCIVNHRQLKELNEYAEDGDLAETLKVYYKKINDLKVMIHNASDKSLESRIALCEDRLNFTFSKFNIVNFDAFDDISGKLSFALALLDSTDSGIIITSLYGHSSCNTYIRYVVSGTTAIKLIDEEKQALNGAINGDRVSSIAE
jgi:hypothetical protein